MRNFSKCFLISLVSVSAGLSACSAQQVTSRYGEAYAYSEMASSGAYGSECAVAVQPCGYYMIPTYHVITTFPEPAPQPVPETPIYEPPVIVEPEPLPPVVIPPMPELPVITPPPSCPEGHIPGYGGEGCIPLTIPRK